MFGNKGIEDFWRNESVCTCDCYFFVSTKLPCQHVFDVMIKHHDDKELKVAQLHERWLLTEATVVQPVVASTISAGSICDRAVPSDCEKYNVARDELIPVIGALQRLPSHKFYECFADLRETLAAFKEKW
ncbi:hypothetical protein PHMEG_00022292 [Phytophthora megakarya]|uniref:SWIM-type domain-containing protein n=1 Tax=Phytophthora megakarya TaxID=4795 RepID=A0A225VJ47_9STRA|nr:hypothetical protein PHMEG_00022292 [Phytophthora megakarya]